MNRRTVIVMLALLGVLLLSSSTTAQLSPNGECVQAKTWHLQKAMNVNHAYRQEWHLGAADAADQLSTMGGSTCSGWRDWANGKTPEAQAQ